MKEEVQATCIYWASLAVPHPPDPPSAKARSLS